MTVKSMPVAAATSLPWQQLTINDHRLPLHSLPPLHVQHLSSCCTELQMLHYKLHIHVRCAVLMFVLRCTLLSPSLIANQHHGASFCVQKHKEFVTSTFLEKVLFQTNENLSQLSLCNFQFFLALTDIAILWQDYTKLLMGKQGLIIAIACDLALT